MTFYDRLKNLMEIHSVERNKLAQIVGLSGSAITQWKQGIIPKADIAIKIAQYFNVSVEYLIFGEEDIQTVSGSQLRGKNIIPFSGSHEDIVMIPFYEIEASAGKGLDIPDLQAEKPVPIMKKFIAPYNPSVVRALEVKGDSMTKIGLFNEDTVFFVPIDDPGDGVYVLSINNKLLVKRVEFDPLGQEIRIISENDRYEPRVLKGESMSDVKIEGKVIGWLHRHPY